MSNSVPNGNATSAQDETQRRLLQLSRLLQLAIDYAATSAEGTVVDLVKELFAQGDFLQAARWIVKVDDLTKLPAQVVNDLHAALPLTFLAIGGGGSFRYPLWQNIDTQLGPHDRRGYRFDDRLVVPVSARSRELIYVHDGLDACSNADGQARLCKEVARIVTERGGVILTAKTIGVDRLTDLARGSSLTPVSTERDKIVTRFSYVPRIAWQVERRAYLFSTLEGGSYD